MAAEPGGKAGRDRGAGKPDHRRRYDEDVRLRAPARIAVVDARDISTPHLPQSPMRKTNRGPTAASAVERNTAGNLEQIRKAEDRACLHARVEHDTDFERRGGCHEPLSLSAKSLTLLAIECAYSRSILQV